MIYKLDLTLNLILFLRETKDFFRICPASPEETKAAKGRDGLALSGYW